MSQLININKIYVYGLSTSGIFINSKLIPINISSSYIANCQNKYGAGVYSISKITCINTTCISSCYATDGGSAIYTFSDTYMFMSTICKCAPNNVGADDNIIIGNSNFHFSELNISQIHTKGATCCQYSESERSIIDRIIQYKSISEDLNINSKSKFIEPIKISSTSNITNSIFLNSSANSVVEFKGCTGVFTFEDCYFSKNSVNLFTRMYAGSIPKIVFVNVIITEGINLGFEGADYLTEGEFPIFFCWI